jgi:thiol-disulfide isomerase/thioredoxin
MIHDVNTLVDTHLKEMVELWDHYTQLWMEGKEQILSKEPLIWETDALFAERLHHELDEFEERIEREADSAAETIIESLQGEFEELIDLFEETDERLATSDRIRLAGNTGAMYAPYVRNERLWPLILTFSDRLVEETSLDLVIDFIGQVRSEEEIRSSIVMFDRMVKENQLNWEVAYHIVADIREETNLELVVGGSNFLDIIRFLVVLDEITVSDDQGTVLFCRTLENPVLVHTFTVDEELNFIARDADPILGLNTLGYNTLEGNSKELRSHRQRILLADPRDTITDKYEKERLAALPPAVAVAPPVGTLETQDGGTEAVADTEELHAIMPNIPLFTLDDKETSFDEVRAGRPAIVNYFASWVPVSKAELSYFEEAWKQHGDEIAFIFLDALDGQRETKATIDTFIKEFPFTAPVYWDEGIFAFIFNTNSLPTTVFFDKDGRVVTGFLGMLSENALEESISLLLK